MESLGALRTEARLDNLGQIRLFLREAALRAGCDPPALRKTLLAVDEACTNVVLHGYENRGGPLEIEVWAGDGCLSVRIRDQAPPFDPTQMAAPDVSIPLEERPVGGLGIFLIRQNIDRVTHRVPECGGNELTLVRRLSAAGAGEEAPSAA